MALRRLPAGLAWKSPAEDDGDALPEITRPTLQSNAEITDPMRVPTRTLRCLVRTR
jgi:hypothetical protein